MTEWIEATKEIDYGDGILRDVKVLIHKTRKDDDGEPLEAVSLSELNKALAKRDDEG